MSQTTSRLRAIARITSQAGAFCFLSVLASAQTRWHVDAAAAPGGDGLSWASAFSSVQDALAIDGVGDKIWVKAGTYRPTEETDTGNPRSATFLLDPGVSLLGGFDGTETAVDQRAGLYSQTILTGDLGVQGDTSDNAYHVVFALNPSGIPPGATRLDGFTIRDGNATDGGGGQGGGVKMFNSALRLANCIIRDNQATFGGGLHGQPASIRITWCEFIDNHAIEKGGALWGQAINYKITHSTFRGNTADRGGAIFLHSINTEIPGTLPIVLIHNSLIHDNSARLGGGVFLGGATFASGKATFSSCTIAYNHATQAGGGIWAGTTADIPALSTLLNCIVWNNTGTTFPNLRGRHGGIASNFQNGTYYGDRNISANPKFVDGPGRNLRLKPGSPAVDAGRNSVVPVDFADSDDDGSLMDMQSIDLDRGRRFKDEPSTPGLERIIDMGAYER